VLLQLQEEKHVYDEVMQEIFQDERVRHINLQEDRISLLQGISSSFAAARTRQAAEGKEWSCWKKKVMGSGLPSVNPGNLQHCVHSVSVTRCKEQWDTKANY
jgi:hypothetical protein